MSWPNTWHVWGRGEMHTGLWWGNLNRCVPRIFHSCPGRGIGDEGGGGGKADPEAM